MPWPNDFFGMNFNPTQPSGAAQGTAPYQAGQMQQRMENNPANFWMNTNPPWFQGAEGTGSWYNPASGQHAYIQGLQGEMPERYVPNAPPAWLLNMQREWELGGGGFEMNPWEGNPNIQGWNQPMITTPGGHNVENFNQDIVDVQAIIDAEEQLSNTRRDDAWADAAARFGQSGMVASTPYMNQLADVAAEEQARQDQIFGTLKYQAGTDFANRQLQEALQRRELEEAAWAQRGAWDMAAQQANAANNLAAWQQMGNWGQANADRDYGAWQMGNEYSQNQMQQMIPMLMAMFGGGG